VAGAAGTATAAYRQPMVTRELRPQPRRRLPSYATCDADDACR